MRCQFTPAPMATLSVAFHDTAGFTL